MIRLVYYCRRWVEFDGVFLRYCDKKGSITKGGLRVKGAMNVPVKIDSSRKLQRYVFNVFDAKNNSLTFSCASSEDRDLCLYLLNRNSNPHPSLQLSLVESPPSPKFVKKAAGVVIVRKPTSGQTSGKKLLSGKFSNYKAKRVTSAKEENPLSGEGAKICC